MEPNLLSHTTRVRLDDLLQRLRAQGCRVTPQRMAVLRILLTNQEHLTVEEIFARVRTDYPMTSLGTIYNTVNLLKEMGEVLEIGMGHGSNHYDGYHPEPHPHLICVKCNIIQDADIPNLEALSQNILRATGFQVLNHRFDFFGICPQCLNKP
jgi:Fur family peroxide stress response transcriptional regulator